MVRFTKFNRLAAAALLTVSAVAFSSGVSGAQPVPTGSLTDNGNGTATMTFDDDGGGALYILVFFPSGTTCQTGDLILVPDLLQLGAEYLAVGEDTGPATLTIEPGLEVLTSSEAPADLPAGEYELCLYWGTPLGGPLVSFLDDLAADLGGTPEPTTTTTVAPTTTTTAPAAEPATPRYTG
jgi:hypothetical protein